MHYLNILNTMNSFKFMVANFHVHDWLPNQIVTFLNFKSKFSSKKLIMKIMQYILQVNSFNVKQK